MTSLCRRTLICKESHLHVHTARFRFTPIHVASSLPHVMRASCMHTKIRRTKISVRRTPRKGSAVYRIPLEALHVVYTCVAPTSFGQPQKTCGLTLVPHEGPRQWIGHIRSPMIRPTTTRNPKPLHYKSPKSRFLIFKKTAQSH